MPRPGFEAFVIEVGKYSKADLPVSDVFAGIWPQTPKEQGNWQCLADQLKRCSLLDTFAPAGLISAC